MASLSEWQRSDHRTFLLHALWSDQKGKVNSWWTFVWQPVQAYWLNFLAQFSFNFYSYRSVQQAHWPTLQREKNVQKGLPTRYQFLQEGLLFCFCLSVKNQWQVSFGSILINFILSISIKIKSLWKCAVILWSTGWFLLLYFKSSFKLDNFKPFTSTVFCIKNCSERTCCLSTAFTVHKMDLKRRHSQEIKPTGKKKAQQQQQNTIWRKIYCCYTQFSCMYNSLLYSTSHFLVLL